MLAAAAIVALFALALLPANAARRDMEEGRDGLERAKAALLAGDPAAASERFIHAKDAFLRARGHARNPLLRLAGILPVLGRTPDAALALADAGGEIAEAGISIAGGLAELPDGLGSLAPRRGRIPIEPFRQLAGPLDAGLIHFRRAGDSLDRVATSWLLGPLAEARDRFQTQLEPLTRSMEAAAVIVDRFPAFLGADGPRRYLFAAENPAELRGTGGLFGNLSVMTADRGRLTFAPFEPATDIPRLAPGAVEPPNADYARLYPDAAGFISVINLTADFPSAATALQRLYEATRDVRLDGVISADPIALAAMLRVSGPVNAPVLGTVTTDNVVPLVTNEAYALIPDSDARKRLLGEVAQLVLARFLQGAPAADAAAAIADAAANGHLKLHTGDPALQRGLALANADGALPGGQGNVVAPIVNNGAGNKIDFYAKRTVRYQVQLGAEGHARADLRVDIQNGAPATGQPRYVIGPYTDDFDAGENVSLVSIYLPPGVELLESSQSGADDGAGEDTELGHTLLSGSVSIPSGGSAWLQYAIGRSEAWTGTTSHGVYRLTYLGQPTILPTGLRLEIQAPSGTQIVRTSVPMEIGGNRATWQGETTGGELTFEIEFQKPILSRAWDALGRFFQRRVCC